MEAGRSRDVSRDPMPNALYNAPWAQWPAGLLGQGSNGGGGTLDTPTGLWGKRPKSVSINNCPSYC